MAPKGSQRWARARQRVNPNNTPAMVGQDALTAMAEQTSADFKQANSSMIEIIGKFIRGQETDFKAVVAALQRWYAAKLELCGPWCELCAAWADYSVDDSTPHVFLRAARHISDNFTSVAIPLAVAQMTLWKMGSFLKDHPEIDGADRKYVHGLIWDTEFGWARTLEMFGIPTAHSGANQTGSVSDGFGHAA